MKHWNKWRDALRWCWNNASENCVVIVLDWNDEEKPNLPTALKFEHSTQSFFVTVQPQNF